MRFRAALSAIERFSTVMALKPIPSADVARRLGENIREFEPDAEVNKEIRAALKDEAQRRRFVVLNNGVTIVARSVKEWPEDPVVMRDVLGL